MLVYEYPPKLSHAGVQAKAVHDLQEHEKIRKNMFRNLLLGAVIIVIGIIAKVLIAQIVLIIIGVCNMAVALLLYWYGNYSRDTSVYTRIYDDHIEHSQRLGFTKNYLYINLNYSDFKDCYQNRYGKLVCHLKDELTSELWTTDEKGENRQDYKPKDNTLTIVFQDTQAKLELVNKFYLQINYPHKVYNKLDDEGYDEYYTDEDIKWDKLGKHGL